MQWSAYAFNHCRCIDEGLRSSSISMLVSAQCMHYPHAYAHALIMSLILSHVPSLTCMYSPHSHCGLRAHPECHICASLARFKLNRQRAGSALQKAGSDHAPQGPVDVRHVSQCALSHHLRVNPQERRRSHGRRRHIQRWYVVLFPGLVLLPGNCTSVVNGFDSTVRVPQ